jgi:hypothetical protein
VTSEEEIRARLPLVVGRSIYQYRPAVVQELLAPLPYIRQCTLRRKWFSTVVVRVEERSPLAYLALDSLYLVDADRMVLPLPANGTVFDLPVITGLTVKTRPGQIVKAAALDTALAFMRALWAVDPGWLERASEFDAGDPRNITLVLASPACRVFLGRTVRREQLLKLGIWDQYGRPTAGPVEYIDLRFTGQIVVKRKTS